jgi:mRNA-degrading endonuclease toxin of MazEF toxin-antitoxin module
VCQLRKGQIVDLDIYDPNGQNKKVRPVVVVDELADTDHFIYVAVSTQFTDPPPDRWILLPWDRGGRAPGGLVERCVAKCNWIGKARRDEIVRRRTQLPAKKMLDIMRALQRDQTQ